MNEFEKAIEITPQDSHRYNVTLADEWAIGTVPHGGYTMAVLHRLAITHFAHTHPKHYPDEAATPISMQVSFLRRTGTGRATLDVQDTKLGARTSTLHVSLLQERDKAPFGLEVKMAGYITVTPASRETGPSARQLSSLRVPAVNLDVLKQTGRDEQSGFALFQSQFLNFRKATRKVAMYTHSDATMLGQAGDGVVQQWCRFVPGRTASASAGEVEKAERRWTNDSVAFLVDMFPSALSGFDRVASLAETGSPETLQGKFWYPTVALNLDLRKRLPQEGVEWLFCRVSSTGIVDGRSDIQVIVMDATGDVVAIASQVGLVLSASRNIGSRQKL